MIEIRYYKLPLNCIPFERIPSLEDLRLEYVYCSSFSLMNYMKLDYYLTGVYNIFSDITNPIDLQDTDLLFGKVLTNKLSTRGKAKCIFVARNEIEIEPNKLPLMQYNSNENREDGGNWFYMKDGNYVLFAAIESTFEKVRHLERNSIYGEAILRLRVVLELLKMNVKRRLLSIDLNQYETIATEVLKADPSLSKASESLISDGVKNWVSPIIQTPLLEDIPTEFRGRLWT